MPLRICANTQMDLFPSETALPECLCSDWQCLNRCSEVSLDCCSLPSVQYSLPPYLKFSDFALSSDMLTEEKEIREAFFYIQKLYSCIVACECESLMVDLDRCVSYVSMAAQNMTLNGDVSSAGSIARQFKHLLLRVESVRDFALKSDSLSTRVIEMNYRFHAVLLIWTNALRTFYLIKDSLISPELLYPPIIGEKSVFSQVATILSYSLLVVARITRVTFVCKCVRSAWQQLYYLLGNDLFSIFEVLLGICYGATTLSMPESPTSCMLFDLRDARNSVSPEIFLEVFCALEFKRPFAANGRSIGACMRCLEKIVTKVTDDRLVLSALCGFLKDLHGAELKGVEIILQTVFNRLASKLTESLSMTSLFMPENGKQWLENVKMHGQNQLEESNYCDDWAAFIRLIFIVLPRSQEAWRSLKPRLFSKFTSKKLREMPLTSFVKLLSLFLACACCSDFEEASNKMLQLFLSVFGDCEKDRLRIILQCIHSLIELCRERQLEECKITNVLAVLMEKLSETEHAFFYVDSYLYVCDKGVILNKLPCFLACMNDMDLCRLLEKSAVVDKVDGPVWEMALKKIDSSFSRQAINYLSHHLKLSCIENPSLANLRMQSVAKALLDEKTALAVTCYDFLKIFFLEVQPEICFPVENLIPVWLLVLMLQPDSESFLTISGHISFGFDRYLNSKGAETTNLYSGNSNSASIAKNIFEKIAVLPSATPVSVRRCLNDWLEILLPALQNLLPKANIEVAEISTRIASYIFEHCACLIFKPPSECISFNRSLFVRFCKLYLQNTLLHRDFKESFLEECFPKFLTGLLRLPVDSQPYLQHVLSDIIVKFRSQFSLKESMVKCLSRNPDVVSALRRKHYKDVSMQKFLTSICN